MSKLLKCKEIFPGCEGEVRAESEEEVVRIAVDHARVVHGVTEIDDAMAAQVKAAVRNA